MGVNSPCVCLYIQNHSVLGMHIHTPREGVRLVAEEEEGCRIGSQHKQSKFTLPWPACMLTPCPTGITSLAVAAIQTACPDSSQVGISTGGRFWTVCQQFPFPYQSEAISNQQKNFKPRRAAILQLGNLSALHIPKLSVATFS